MFSILSRITTEALILIATGNSYSEKFHMNCNCREKKIELKVEKKIASKLYRYNLKSKITTFKYRLVYKIFIIVVATDQL